MAWSSAALIPAPEDAVRFQTSELGSAYFSMRAVVCPKRKRPVREEGRQEVATYNHGCQVVSPVMIRPCSRSFQRLARMDCQPYSVGPRFREKTHLFAIRLDLRLELLGEVGASYVESAFVVVDEKFQSSQLVVVEGTMVTGKTDISKYTWRRWSITNLGAFPSPRAKEEVSSQLMYSLDQEIMAASSSEVQSELPPFLRIRMPFTTLVMPFKSL